MENDVARAHSLIILPRFRAFRGIVIAGVFIIVSMTPTARSGNQTAPSGKPAAKKIAVLQKRMDSLAFVREKLLNDSLQAAAKKESERLQILGEILRINGLIAACDSVLGRAEESMAGVKTGNEKKIAQKKNNIQDLSLKKKKLDDRIALAEAQVSSKTKERNRLSRSSETAIKRYERLRAPYEEAMKHADMELQRVKGEQQLLLALRKKLEIDLVVFQVRDSMDNAVKMGGSRKKANKRTDRWEGALDSLNAKQDALLNTYKGIRLREGSLTGLTVRQKMAAVDSALRRNEKLIPAATIPHNKARSELLAFERATPPPKIPPHERLDTAIATMKRELFIMADASDSLGMMIEEERNAIATLASAGPGESDDMDTMVSWKKRERLSLVKKRSALQQDSLRRQEKNDGELRRFADELHLLNSQMVIVQDDLIQSQAGSGSGNAGRVPAYRTEKEAGTEDDFGEPVLEADPGRDVVESAKGELAGLIDQREKMLLNIKYTEKMLSKAQREIKQQDKLIKIKKKEVDRLAKKRGTMEGPSDSEAAARGTEIAQKRLEEIYSLINKNRVSLAVQRFRQLRPFLKAKLDPEAFQTLKLTLEQMGGVLQ
ncbi:MAG: hypothetical protein JXA71_06995 [Chitinispirillaceae bacterium]|nr:hypothetical protein [Chitinispirillaceae bacterium]